MSILQVDTCTDVWTVISGTVLFSSDELLKYFLWKLVVRYVL